METTREMGQGISSHTRASASDNSSGKNSAEDVVRGQPPNNASMFFVKDQGNAAGMRELFVDIGVQLLVGVTVVAAASYIAEYLKERNLGRGGSVDLKRINSILRRRGKRKVELNKYELLVANDLIDPADIDVSFDSIGGLRAQKDNIRSILIDPLHHPALYASRGSVVGAPKGVMFYGPPGTGKTMMAKAIAKECGACFINLRLSTVQDKWFGESVRVARAAFTLARKLAPCIIFIDEMEIFLHNRSSGSSSSEANGHIKAEFLTEWDGLLTDAKRSEDDGFGVVVVGATNRPSDVDDAFLRRMPSKYCMSLPTCEEREEILKSLLRQQVGSTNLGHVAAETKGYSGSDLQELCRVASLFGIRETIEARRHGQPQNDQVRPLNTEDFNRALKEVRSTQSASAEFRQRQHAADAMHQGANDSYNGDGLDLEAVYRALVAASHRRSGPVDAEPLD